MTSIADRLWATSDHLLEAGTPHILGLSGAQGSGKSTAVTRLQERLGDRLAVLSLDDFYLPLAERQHLADTVSPLLATRGVPGTHDIGWLTSTIERLRQSSPEDSASIPRFDKASDDRLPPSEWARITGRPDLIVVEGWCIGALAAPDFLSAPPLNEVERTDENMACRRFQQAALTGPYLDLWRTFDAFMHLVPPSWETVAVWRKQQEIANLGLGSDPLPADRAAWVDRFIQHYERITRDMAAGHRMPGDVVQLDAQRRPQPAV
jgi:D-glycerate 3-kinase